MPKKRCRRCGVLLTEKQQATGIHWCNPKFQYPMISYEIRVRFNACGGLGKHSAKVIGAAIKDGIASNAYGYPDYNTYLRFRQRDQPIRVTFIRRGRARRKSR